MDISIASARAGVKARAEIARSYLPSGTELRTAVTYPAEADPPDPPTREMINEPLTLGVKAVDGLLTIGKGQRIGIFAGSGVGKSTLLGMFARNTKADINVIALIGERGREVRALIERDLGPEGMKRSVVVIATHNGMYEKVLSNVQEIKARKGRVIALVSEGDTAMTQLADEVIVLPDTLECLEPLLTTVPLQLLAYHVAVCKGKDVDQPRNLAKSVTVE